MSETNNEPVLFGAEHVRVYQETGGAQGHHWIRGTTVLLLTTTGRVSGEERTTPLIYRYIDGTYIVVASAGGAETHPDWYLNLQAEPHARVQVGADSYDVAARTATRDERPHLWQAMAEAWPDYDNYAEKTRRTIPIVALEPTN